MGWQPTVGHRCLWGLNLLGLAVPALAFARGSLLLHMGRWGVGGRLGLLVRLAPGVRGVIAQTAAVDQPHPASHPRGPSVEAAPDGLRPGWLPPREEAR